MTGQEQQHVELSLGERHPLAAHEHTPGGGLDRHVAELDRRLMGRGGVDAAQHGVDPRDQLRGRERLDHVVVGTQAQADHPVGLLPLGGQEDQRDRLAVGLAQPAHDLEAVESGEHQVEHDQIRTLIGHQLQRPNAVAGDPRPVAGPLQVA